MTLVISAILPLKFFPAPIVEQRMLEQVMSVNKNLQQWNSPANPVEGLQQMAPNSANQLKLPDEFSKGKF